MPLPVRTFVASTGLGRVRTRTSPGLLRLISGEAGFPDHLFPVVHLYIVAMRKPEIARRRIVQLQKGEGEVELQRIFSVLPASPAFPGAFQCSGGPSRSSLNSDFRATSKPSRNAA